MEKNDKTPEIAIQKAKGGTRYRYNNKREDIVISSIDNFGTVSLIYCKITHDLNVFDNWASKWIDASGINRDCEIEGVEDFQ